jgi:hypothetical protein
VHDLHMHSPGNTNMSSSGKSSPCVIGENSGAIRDKTVAVGPYFMCPPPTGDRAEPETDSPNLGLTDAGGSSSGSPLSSSGPQPDPHAGGATRSSTAHGGGIASPPVSPLPQLDPAADRLCHGDLHPGIFYGSNCCGCSCAARHLSDNNINPDASS